MNKIQKNKIVDMEVEFFMPDGESLGFFNTFEFMDLRVQAKREKVWGIYCNFNGYIIQMDHHGEMSDYPQGFYDMMTNQLMELL